MLVIAESSAEFSGCRRYRYVLKRKWAAGPAVMFIGLNPSTADEHVDDPTIRRCIGFAKRWGYGTLIMANLYAWRSRDPRGLWVVDENPIGEDGPVDNRNHVWLYTLARQEADLVVAAWGANSGPCLAQPDRVLELVAPCKALALTQSGQPRHPLYVRGDVEPIPYP